jgi:hypothetical protein
MVASKQARPGESQPAERVPGQSIHSRLEVDYLWALLEQPWQPGAQDGEVLLVAGAVGKLDVEGAVAAR